MAKNTRKVMSNSVDTYGAPTSRAASLQNMEFPLQIKRQYAGPIDTTEIFTDLASAQEYASSGATKYVGQIIQVVVDNVATAYIIQGDGTLEEVGSAMATDGASIEIVDGKLQIVGFDNISQAEVLPFAVANEEGEGYHIEWKQADQSSVQGLEGRVSTLETTIQSKVDNTKVGGSELGLVKNHVDEAGTGDVVIGTDGTMHVDKVATAENAEAIGTLTEESIATKESVTTLNQTVTQINNTLGNLTDGTTPAPEATHAASADAATKLANAREFSITGDGTASAISFDGTGDVALNLLLATVATPGTGCKVTVDAKGRVTQVQALTAGDIPTLTTDKISGLGTAATKNTGTAVGNVVVVASDGKIDASLMPALAITNTSVVDSQAAMLELTAQIGDIAIRTDEHKSYILTADDATQLGSWTWLQTPDCKIISVNGKTGAVVLTTDDIAEGSNNQYYTDEKVEAVIAATASTALTDSDDLVRYTDTIIIDGNAQ